jgi:hypothetical protein
VGVAVVRPARKPAEQARDNNIKTTNIAVMAVVGLDFIFSPKWEQQFVELILTRTSPDASFPRILSTKIL